MGHKKGLMLVALPNTFKVPVNSYNKSIMDMVTIKKEKKNEKDGNRNDFVSAVVKLGVGGCLKLLCYVYLIILIEGE